jgi:hypothetical protein
LKPEKRRFKDCGRAEVVRCARRMRLSRSIYRGYRADVCEAIETFLMALGT